jgi:putative flippase GtrA
MKQLTRFLAVGLFNSVLGYIVIFGFMYIVKISPEISNVAGYAVGLVTSYILNRKYTFNSKQNQPNEIVRFLSVFVVAYASNFVILIILIHRVGVHEGASQILAGLIYVIASFIMNKYYVFKSPNISKVR